MGDNVMLDCRLQVGVLELLEGLGTRSELSLSQMFSSGGVPVLVRLLELDRSCGCVKAPIAVVLPVVKLLKAMSGEHGLLQWQLCILYQYIMYGIHQCTI